MNHRASRRFWDGYNRLSAEVQRLADANYARLRADPTHPSLHFRRIGRFWSVRVGLHYRALAVDDPDGPVWFWIGPHAEYDQLISRA